VNWLDAVLIAILAGGVYRGLKTGFILSCIRLAGIGAAFLVASRYYREAGELLERQFHLADVLATWLTQFYNPVVPTAPPQPGQGFVLLPGQNEALSASALVPPASAFQQYVYTLARGLINAGVFVVLFGVVGRLWSFIGDQVTFFRRWSLFRPFDRLGGLFLGAAGGFVLGAVLVLLLHHAAGLGVFLKGSENFLTKAVNDAVLVPYYDGFLRVVSGFSLMGAEKDPGLPTI
jgi:uncharacterized membrane protein required for colicin V production